jgi:hypothetical protein
VIRARAEPPTAVALPAVESLATDSDGNVYVGGGSTVFRIAAAGPGAGTIEVVAGTGGFGHSGDGGPATAAQLRSPSALAVDGLGNVFIFDFISARIRRVGGPGQPDAGIISTVVGTGAAASTGDGGPATAASIAARDIAIDGSSLIVVERARLRVVPQSGPGAGIITTVAGTGVPGFAGDGGPLLAAQLDAYQLAIAPDGTWWLSDIGNARLRRIDLTANTIDTVAELAAYDVTTDADGAPLVLDYDARQVRRVDVDTGATSAVAGRGGASWPGDGAPALSLGVDYVGGIAASPASGWYLSDGIYPRIWYVPGPGEPDAGVVRVVAGNPTFGAPLGDGGPALEAGLAGPSGLAVDGAGNLYIAEGARVRRVGGPDQPDEGIIETVAGTGSFGYAGDGGPATAAQLGSASALAVDADGALFIGDAACACVRRVGAPDAADAGIITTVAGTGTYGFSGDGGPATSAQLASPVALAVDGDRLCIADQQNQRVRCVDGDGQIDTAAGTGEATHSGDGGAATAAGIANPSGLAFEPSGALLIAEGSTVRRVEDGVITTIAGAVDGVDSGDGGPALAAALDALGPLAIAPDGTVAFAEAYYARVRSLRGQPAIIETLLGRRRPIAGLGPAASARLADPRQLVRTPRGLLVAGGGVGVVERFRAGAAHLDVVVGRYSHATATADLAAFRGADFGAVGGVAFDAAHEWLLLTETSTSRLHVVEVDVDAPATSWTITEVGSGTPGHLDGPLATARFRTPTGLFFDDATGVLLVADTGNHVVRAIDLSRGLAAATVSTVAGTPAVLGFFGDGGAATDALLYAPTAIAIGPTGDLFIADTANHRVRRIESGSGMISTVLGDGVAASSGEGAPATAFPVDAPGGLVLDDRGNLFVSSSTSVRLLPATDDGVVDGLGPVRTIYGAAPRTTFPELATACLGGVELSADASVLVADRCAGLLVELERRPASP